MARVLCITWYLRAEITQEVMQSTEILDYQKTWCNQVDLLYNINIWLINGLHYIMRSLGDAKWPQIASQHFICHNKRTVKEEDLRLGQEFGISIFCIKVTRIIVQKSLFNDLPSKFTLSKDVVRPYDYVTTEEIVNETL